MNPRIEAKSVSEDGDVLKFTLSGVNVSIANSIRRTILSDIPCVVFKTSPNEENTANIILNTSRFNNEIIKQRLSCIPIHISDLQMPLKNYLMEVNVENLTDTMLYVTTKDFKIKNLTTGDYLSEKDTQAIFPPSDQTGYYIDFLRLRPKISNEIPGESINLTCKFTISNAKDSGTFNVVSTCSYGYTIDDVKMEIELGKKMKEWKDQGLKTEDVKFEADNWKLLDGLRITKPDSFDYIIQSLGVFTNQELIHKACDILIQKLLDVTADDELQIVPAENTMSNCYDIILKNEDYTIGKAIEYMFYAKYFNDTQVLTYCGFKKMHPHDSDSIVRLAYKDVVDKAMIRGHLESCIELLTQILDKIKKMI